MKVRIDADICTGHGLCYVHAPHVFSDDEHGYGYVVAGEVAEDSALAESARHAAANCPEGAIRIEE